VSNTTVELSVQSFSDGTVEILGEGSHPVADVVNTTEPQPYEQASSALRVSGPGPVTPPPGRLSVSQYQEWIDRLRSQGYTVDAPSISA